MADQEDVRRIALGLPGTSESDTHFAFAVRNKGKDKGFVWTWNEPSSRSGRASRATT